MTSLLDEYEVRARLFPGLLALLAVPVALVAIGARDNPILTAFGSLVSAGGGALLLASIVRERGKKLETRLYQEWGGPPTTLLLRLRGASAADEIRQRRREKIEAVIGVKLPSGPDEATDTATADGVYASVTAELQARTRDRTKFPLIFAENCNYGYHRNMRGLLSIGRCVSVVGLVVLFGLSALNQFSVRFAYPWYDLIVGLAMNFSLVVFWWCYPSEKRVRQAADEYAKQLLDAVFAL